MEQHHRSTATSLLRNRFIAVAGVCLAVGFLSGPPARAAVLYSDLVDATARTNTSTLTAYIDDDDTTELIGRSGSGGPVHRAVILQFLLPDLGSVSNPFTSASLTFNYTGTNGTLTGENVDLYGLPRRAVPARARACGPPRAGRCGRKSPAVARRRRRWR
jgi:hypothetical protein